jgi:hypothetical protein
MFQQPRLHKGLNFYFFRFAEKVDHCIAGQRKGKTLKMTWNAPKHFLLGQSGKNLEKLDDGWPESEKDVFQAALRMVVVKDSR